MEALTKFLVCIGIFLLSLLPVWLVSIAYCVIGPQDFWQSALVIGLGAYFCAGIQIFMLLGALIFIFMLITDEF